MTNKTTSRRALSGSFNGTVSAMEIIGYAVNKQPAIDLYSISVAL